MLSKLHGTALRKLGQSSAVASKYVATRSVLNPLLWLSAIITPICILASLFAPVPLLYALIVLAFIPPVAAVIAYTCFAVTYPNRLQSEEFVLQQQWVAAQIGDNKTKEVITLEGSAATPTANTAMIDGSKQ